MKDLNSLKSAFNKEINGEQSVFVVLENANKHQVGISNYGARITHLIVADSHGDKKDVVLGFNSIEEYLNAKELYHGVIVGPYANRIANGKFTLDDKEYILQQNNGTNCLHGADAGYHLKFWKVNYVADNEVILTTHTNIGEGGFPGGLTVSINYFFSDEDELIMTYNATASVDNYINVTNHAYFNLNGEETNDITTHKVKINAEKFVEITKDCVPTGKLKNVIDTPFDFSDFKIINKDIEEHDEQLIIGKGYDHSFVLKEDNDNEMILAASAIGDISGIKLQVFTTEPAVQFYTGNYLGSGDTGKSGVVYKDRSGFCFETQHHPDSPNQPDFPSTLLKEISHFKSKTIYKFSAFYI